jgi:hypothetical protein
MRLLRPVRLSLVGVLVSVLSCAFAPSASAMQGEKKQPAKMEEAQRLEAQALIALVDDFANGKTPANPLPVRWEQNHFIKALADKTYVPFTLAIEPGALTARGVAVYLRVVAKGSPAVAAPQAADKKDDKKDDKKAEGRSQYAFEDLFFTDVPASTDGPQRLRRAFAVAPGDYDVYIAVKERAAGGAAPTATASAAGAAPPAGAADAGSAAKAGVVKQEISAPNLAGQEFTTSSVILAKSVEVLQAPLSTENQAENPYTFGQMKIEPAAEPKFSKKAALSVILWIYGAKIDDTTKKPDVSMDFKFYQKTGDKETYFNKTEPQLLNAQTLPPQFDLAAGHQLLGTLELPLTSFPEGDYRLEIEVQDKAASQKLTRDVTFSVGAQ